MPFEVHPIEQANNFLSDNAGPERTVNEVASEIKQVYEEVAKKGGEIIASHHVQVVTGIHQGNEAPWLVLVAKYE